MSESMNKFFDNLNSIAKELEIKAENGVPLPEGAAMKVEEFSRQIQAIEKKSAVLRNIEKK